MRRPRATLRGIGCLAAWVLGATVSATEGDWPRWSGPDRNLTSLGNGVFESRDFGLEHLWRRALGSGYSSVVIAGDRVLTGFSDGASDFLVCLDAGSGAERWRYRIGDTYRGHNGSDDGPIATPTVEGDLVFNVGPRGRLSALRLESGEELWAHDLVEALGGREPEYGFASTPAVSGDIVVVQTGGPAGRAITGFDRRTGAVRWSTGDDPISYQSPQILKLGGRRQVVAVTDAHLLGLDPGTGVELWRRQHPTATDHPFSHPVTVGEDGLLLTYWPESVLFRVLEGEGGFRVEEVWRRNTLHSSYAIPIPFENHLYGFAGRFLTCVDAATGETHWKSREPGGISLVLVDGHLVILTLDGELVVAEATPSGYVEKARVEALGRGNHTRPSFAAGRFFVRNLEEIAAIRVGEPPAAPAAAPAPPPLLGDFGSFVGSVLAAAPERRRGMVEGYLAARPRSPIVEEGGLTHFVYRGEVEDLALVGYLFPDGNEAGMFRIPGTDLWFHSVVLPPASHFVYTYSVFDEAFPDPGNPRTVGPEGRVQSVITTAGWTPPPHLGEPRGPRGRLESFPWESEILGNERQVKIYLPPGYDDSGDHYPVLFVNNGDLALSQGRYDRALDHLIGSRVAPLLAVFLPRGDPSEFGGDGTDEFTRALTRELLPRVDAAYRTRSTRDARGLLGVGSGGFAALYAAFHEPGIFSRAAAQSYYHGNLYEELLSRIGSARGEVRTLFQWSSHDYADPAEDFSARRDAQVVAERLRERGGSPAILESTDGAGWGMWSADIDRILEWFFPAPGVRAAASTPVPAGGSPADRIP